MDKSPAPHYPLRRCWLILFEVGFSELLRASPDRKHGTTVLPPVTRTPITKLGEPVFDDLDGPVRLPHDLDDEKLLSVMCPATSVAERPRSYLRRRFQRALSAEAPRALQALALDLGFRYSSALYHRFPELCQAMVRKNRRWRQSEDDKIRHTLSQAATENPPPSMKEVAARLGYSATALRARFPELSAALAARKPESQLLDQERWRARLEAALLDRPASLADVAQSVGRSVGHLRSLFPQLWRRISARYAEAKKQAAVQTRLRFCAEIRTAVIGLHEHGIHPSRKRVFAAIPEPSMRCSHTLDKQIAETLRELTTPSARPLS